MPAKPTSVKLALPSKPIEPHQFFFQQPFCIYGRKGIGKTTAAMAAQWMLDAEYGKNKKHVLNFRFEPGRRNLRILQVPTETNRRLVWSTFKDYLELFCEDDKMAVAVIDSIDKAYDACFEHVCQNAGVSHPKEAKRDAPAIWDAIKVEFEATMYAINECGKSFVALSHEKLKIEEMPDGTEFERFDLSCKPAAAKIVKDMCEFVIYYGYSGATEEKAKGGHRVMTIRNDDNVVECACGRDDVFLQPDGEPLYRFAIPTDASLVGKTLQAAYDNELYDFNRDLEAEAKAQAARQRQAAKKNR
jgi:AAA domain